MRFVRFAAGAAVRYGRLEAGEVEELSSPAWLGGVGTGRRFRLEDVRLLAPCEPTKIVGVGLNYRDHAAELGMAVPEEPVIFLKPATSVLGPEEAIRLPPESGRVDYEAELAVVVGRRCRRVPESEAMSVVAGFVCFNDVTARDLQRRDGQWTRAKSFDTFSPLGPWVVTTDEVRWNDVEVRCLVNGEVRQMSRTSNLIFGVERLVAFVSSVMTLEPGDVVTTGTPPGVGPLRAGDTVEVVVEGVGVLRNRVVGA